MSELIVEVCEVLEVKPHPNADRLDLIQIKGWEVVVQKDLLKPGDPVVYFPPDSVLTEELADRLGIRKYLVPVKREGEVTGYRVRAARLRGVASYGTIDSQVPEGVDVGTDVAAMYGVTKWEPPPQSMGGLPGLKGKQYRANVSAAFHKYKSIEHLRNNRTVFKDGDPVVVTEKIHGCLFYDTRILLADGQRKKIGDIVKYKMQVEVMTCNLETGNLEPKPVTNWYENGIADSWHQVSFTPYTFGKSDRKIYCTPNHKFRVGDEWIEAENLKPGMMVSRPHITLNYFQKQLIYGSLIGDGSMGPLGKDGNHKGFYCSHSVDQIEYLNLKKKIFGPLVAGEDQATSGYGSEMHRFHTSFIPEITKLYQAAYVGYEKVLPDEFLNQLDPMALAFWFMDDGSRSHSEIQSDRATIATNAYSEETVRRFADMFRIRYGLNPSVRDSSGWRLHFKTEDSERFFGLISPYVIPSMQYKLPPEFRGGSFWTGNQFPSDHDKTLTPVEITDVRPITPPNMYGCKKIKYDLEVADNHNFFANEILVHNSNDRVGLIRINRDPEPGILGFIQRAWRRVFGEPAAKFEWMAGSHNVIREVYNADGSLADYSLPFRYDGVKTLLTELSAGKDDVILFGEIYGSGVQDMAYGLKDGAKDYAAFDISVNGRYLDADEKFVLFAKHRIPMVPILYMGPFYWGIIERHTDGPTSMCSPCDAGPFKGREGIVVTALAEPADYPGRKIFKSVSADYLARANGTDSH